MQAGESADDEAKALLCFKEATPLLNRIPGSLAGFMNEHMDQLLRWARHRSIRSLRGAVVDLLHKAQCQLNWELETMMKGLRLQHSFEDMCLRKIKCV